MKKICIYGVGAVGGFMGTLLARSGCEVSAVARGATLAALKTKGLRLQFENEILTQPITASDDPRDLGAQDLVIVAVKAQSLPAIAEKIPALIGPQTTILTAMNGVPWWFFDGFGQSCQGLRLHSVDPDGTIAAAIPTGQVVGGVVHGSFASTNPVSPATFSVKRSSSADRTEPSPTHWPSWPTCWRRPAWTSRSHRIFNATSGSSCGAT